MTDLVYVIIRIGPSLTSGTPSVAEECQESSSKNTTSAHGAPTTPGPPLSKSGPDSDADSATLVATWFPAVLIKKKTEN